MKFKYPKYRERVKLLRMPLGSGRWSSWRKAMIPKRDARGYKNRSDKHEGSTRISLEKTIPKSCGIYEWKMVKQQEEKVVYVGFTCNDNEALKGRIMEYCKNGSHKENVINLALKDGYELHVRFKKFGTMGKSEEAENDLLERYNYAWNIRSNGLREPLPNK